MSAKLTALSMLLVLLLLIAYTFGAFVSQDLSPAGWAVWLRALLAIFVTVFFLMGVAEIAGGKE